MTSYVNSLSHAYIVAADGAKRRMDMALGLAQSIVCGSGTGKPCGVCRNCAKAKKHVHPDILLVERGADESGKTRQSIYVNQIRELRADAPVLPNEAARKVYVITDAQLMNASAQNALLNILEEPPSHAAFILCVPNAATLLDTVRSRCVLIRDGASEGETEAEADAGADAEAKKLAAEYLSLLSQGDLPALMRFCVALEANDQQAMALFAKAGSFAVADMLAGRADAFGASHQQLIARAAIFAKCAEYLAFNVGVKHICGFLAAAEMR